MGSTPKVTCGTFCRASRSIPSIASKNCCHGMSQRNLTNVHLALPKQSRSFCPDGLRLTLTVLLLHVQNVVLDLERKLVGVAIGTSAAVAEPLIAALLITVEHL